MLLGSGLLLLPFFSLGLRTGSSSSFCLWSSLDFIQSIKGIQLRLEECMMSFDVEALLTSVPIEPAIAIFVDPHLGLLAYSQYFSGVVLWSLPSSSNPAIRISSAILNTFVIPLKSSSSFWIMSPDGAKTNGNFMYLYLPNGQKNVVKCDDCSSSFRLW